MFSDYNIRMTICKEVKMKKTTFKEILEQLGIQSSDEFYDTMKPYWGESADAIMTYNPKNGDVEIGSIYSNDRFNLDCGQMFLYIDPLKQGLKLI